MCDICVHFHVQGSELISKVSSPSDKLDSPVLAFTSLERFNAVRLVQTIHSSLAELNKVLRGSSLLTTTVQRLAAALLRHEVSGRVTLVERGCVCCSIYLCMNALSHVR